MVPSTAPIGAIRSSIWQPMDASTRQSNAIVRQRMSILSLACSREGNRGGGKLETLSSASRVESSSSFLSFPHILCHCCIHDSSPRLLKDTRYNLHCAREQVLLPDSIVLFQTIVDFLSPTLEPLLFDDASSRSATYSSIIYRNQEQRCLAISKPAHGF